MEALLAHCTASFSQHGGLFAVFFMGGMMGGFTHCLAMCGPMVAGQSACAGGCGTRLSRGVQWGYHLGRVTTYGALGFAAALLARHIAAFSFWPVLSSVMLVLAGVMFMASSLRRSAHTPCRVARGTAYVRGVLMGFMPCGLLYAALMMAATLAHPLSGMVAMVLFACGTMPALLIASGSVQLLHRSWQPVIQRIGRVAMACNGAMLVMMAGKLVG